jgi:hypothetical protein
MIFALSGCGYAADLSEGDRTVGFEDTGTNEVCFAGG